MQRILFCVGNHYEIKGKYGRWKNAVEGKCPKVNVSKTKCMQLLFGKKVLF